MLRPLILLGSLILGSAFTFAQASVSNGTAPSNAQVDRTPSGPDQASPSDLKPAIPGAAEGKANGSALRPEGAKSGLPGRAAGNKPDTDRNAGEPENGNPTTPRPVNTISQPTLGNTMRWLWSAIGIVGVLVLIGILMSRSRPEDRVRRQDLNVVAMENRDKVRRDDQIRRAG